MPASKIALDGLADLQVLLDHTDSVISYRNECRRCEINPASATCRRSLNYAADFVARIDRRVPQKSRVDSRPTVRLSPRSRASCDRIGWPRAGEPSSGDARRTAQVGL